MTDTLYARERAAVQGLSWQLGTDVKTRWESCRYSRRFMAYAGKCLVFFTLDAAGRPKNKAVIRCTEISASSLHGFSSSWASASGPANETTTIGQVPAELAPGVFVWHTNFSDAQYAPHKGVYGLRTSLILSTAASYKTSRTDVVHCLELAGFMAEYPE